MKKSVAMFAAIIGNDFINTPYKIQSPTPTLNITSITSDMSSVLRVRHVRITCGKNAVVVSAPANNPRASR